MSWNLSTFKKLCGDAVLRFLLCSKFNAPCFTLMTYHAKRFMHRIYFVKFHFRRYWEWKKLDHIHGHLSSLEPKWRIIWRLFNFDFSFILIYCRSDISEITFFCNWNKFLWKLGCWPENDNYWTTWGEPYFKHSSLEKTVFNLSTKHWLLHSLTSFS